MKEWAKKGLNFLGFYHPLQSFYRNLIFKCTLLLSRQKYKPLKGSGFLCNACNERYLAFIPEFPSAENSRAIEEHQVVAGYGNNILCPNCLSTARERLVLAILQNSDLDGKNILHLSPEKKLYPFLKSKATVTTADLLPGFYKTIDGLVQKQDATNFSFANETFDMVIANHILEHIPDDRKAMSEIFRVLKPGGTAVLQVPYSQSIAHTLEEPGINNPAEQSFRFGQKDHVRIYALSDYMHRLQQAGFLVEMIPYQALKKFHVHRIQKNECFLQILKPTGKAG